MPQAFIAFNELDPAHEHGTAESGLLMRLENVIPAYGGYRSFPKAVDGDDAAVYLTSAFYADYGVQHYFGVAGNSASLWIINNANGLLADISGPGPYSNAGRAWKFAAYGDDVWAFNGIDHPQRRTAGAGNFANGIASTLIPLARCGAAVREFMVVGALATAGRFSDEIAWSDINDSTWYDDKTGARPASLAGSKRIRMPAGDVTAVVGGQYGVIFKSHSMHSLQLTGGSDVWRLDDLSPTVGTEYPSSIVSCSDGVRRFWGGDDFYEQAGLGAPMPIGNEAIKALMLDASAHSGMGFKKLSPNPSGIDSDVLIFGADEENYGCVFWFYCGTGDVPSSGANRGILYNYRTQQWASFVVTGVYFSCACTSHARLPFVNYPGQIMAARVNGAGNGVYCTFTSSTNYAITVATQRFSLGRDQAAGKLNRVQIDGALPVVTLNQQTLSPDYQLAAVPSGLAVRIVAANDQLFKAQTDADGTQISPRSESYTMADANDFGWLPHVVAGESFLLELTVPETTTALRGLPGCWINYNRISP